MNKEEANLRNQIGKKYSKNLVDMTTKAIVSYEVNSSYLKLCWKKGLIFLHELDKLGFKIIPK
jgi:hypothetical protein